MKGTSIPNHEWSFFSSKKDSDGKQFDINQEIKKIKGTNEAIKFFKCTINKKYKQQHPDKIKDFLLPPNNPPSKMQIVLHFTAGYIKGDVAILTRGVGRNKDGEPIEPWRVSVPFIIARNGKIVKLWDEKKHWANHLGPGAVGGNETMSKKTISIELSNVGPLELKGEDLHTIYSTEKKPDIYCKKEETNLYTTLDKSFRGKKYFASFTNAQYKSLITLLKYLTAKHDIPKKFLSDKKRDKTLTKKELNDFRGIVSHVNYRGKNKWNKWEKWDIGPAFDWDRVIKGLTKKPINSRGGKSTQDKKKRTDERNFSKSQKDDRTYSKPSKDDNRTFSKPHKDDRKLS